MNNAIRTRAMYSWKQPAQIILNDFFIAGFYELGTRHAHSYVTSVNRSQFGVTQSRMKHTAFGKLEIDGIVAVLQVLLWKVTRNPLGVVRTLLSSSKEHLHSRRYHTTTLWFAYAASSRISRYFVVTSLRTVITELKMTKRRSGRDSEWSNEFSVWRIIPRAQEYKSPLSDLATTHETLCENQQKDSPLNTSSSNK